MKIAILSCNTGGGHNAAAAALAEELSARGHESRTYNTLDFLPKGAADLISRGHDFAYRYAPKLYGAAIAWRRSAPRRCCMKTASGASAPCMRRWWTWEPTRPSASTCSRP